ncbi:hypothetical protein COP2_005267 [Malus domestica]
MVALLNESLGRHDCCPSIVFFFFLIADSGRSSNREPEAELTSAQEQQQSATPLNDLSCLPVHSIWSSASSSTVYPYWLSRAGVVVDPVDDA